MDPVRYPVKQTKYIAQRIFMNNLIKKHLKKLLLLVPLLCSYGVYGMRAGKALRPKPVSIQKMQKRLQGVPLRPGSLFDRIKKVPDASAQPPVQPLTKKERDSIQIPLIQEIMANSDLLDILYSPLGAIEVIVDESSAEKQPVDIARSSGFAPQFEITRILNNPDTNGSEKIGEIAKVAPQLIAVSQQLAKEPSLAPLFHRFIQDHQLMRQGAAAQRKKAVKKPAKKSKSPASAVADNLGSRAVIAAQQKGIVLKAMEAGARFKDGNGFGLPLAELLLKSNGEIKRLFKVRALEVHPDKGGDAELFVKLHELKDLLVTKKGRALLEVAVYADKHPAIVQLLIDGKAEASPKLARLLLKAAPAVSGPVQAITLPGSTVETIAHALPGVDITPAVAAQLAVRSALDHHAGPGSAEPLLAGPSLGNSDMSGDIPPLAAQPQDSGHVGQIIPAGPGNILPSISDGINGDATSKKEEIKVPAVIQKPAGDIAPSMPAIPIKKRRFVDISEFLRRAEAIEAALRQDNAKIDQALKRIDAALAI